MAPNSVSTPCTGLVPRASQSTNIHGVFSLILPALSPRSQRTSVDLRAAPSPVLMALSAMIADQRRRGSRGEPAVLVDPVRIPVPALSRSGPMGHKSTLPHPKLGLQLP